MNIATFDGEHAAGLRAIRKAILSAVEFISQAGAEPAGFSMLPITGEHAAKVLMWQFFEHHPR